MHRPSLPVAITLCIFVMACSDREPAAPAAIESAEMTNPFFTESSLPYGMPPFDLIETEHYVPAFERGMAEQLSEIEAIATNPEPASFENTIVALERSGQLLDRPRRVFDAMVSAHTNDALKEIQTEMAPN
jgi:peptidyl-dipeptidase Dcp